ncbi:TonB-dependent receptor [Congregibacter variabilis]|uniref:TonB-dependent receptor n=1 Tax=Congregibacter variabilis TaxID=3081200 RepID=A0ABZ0HYL0_9GAMM|nr:TonB-dependent receptor [Congregibacter sp. IMCC43200]
MPLDQRRNHRSSLVCAQAVNPPLCSALTLTLCLAMAGDACAQRAAENVVRSVSDAFGASVGNEQIGLYSISNVRGFSPTAAGNVRVEGLFIDRATRDFSNRLIDGSTIRAGLAAQGYPLPAPTGIVDFSLRRVADEPTHSVIVERSAYGGALVATDLQVRIRDGLEAAFGVGYEAREVGDGTNDKSVSAGGNIRYAPSDIAELTVFADYIEELGNQFSQRYFTDGPWLPPRVTTRKFVGQPWVEFKGPRYNAGLLANYRPGNWDYRLGVFRSSRERDIQSAQLYLEVQPDGSARRQSALGPPTTLESDSLEARATRYILEGNRQHSLTVNLRALQRYRDYGGTVGIDLGPGNIDEPVFYDKPEVEFGELTRESVEQFTLGLSYDLQWENIGQLNLGVQQADYTRNVQSPDGQTVSVEENPLLYNVTANARLGERLVAYGGIVRGFEESPVAPSSATNQNEAPPAAQTQQIDAGLRLAAGKLTAVAGVFEIEKPFFGLDENRFFGEQGMQVNRGVELSLAGPVTDALQLVVGTVLYDIGLSGDAVDAGRLADSPVGAITRSTTVNLDYRPAWAPGWSFDLGLTSRGEQNGDAQGLVKIEPRTLLDLGLRRQFSLASNDVVIRGRLTNVFDEFGWDASSTNDLRYVAPRAFSLSLRMDI